ncbi:MAG: hypothetical protein HYZ44_02725 [Bacteroidetes bacterium]|nr:hypothetical protein [Bacteroidota bacterium]
MNMAVKKVELIEWLVQLQDENMLNRIELLKQGAVEGYYKSRMPKNELELKKKLEESERDIEEGRTYSQQEVENHFFSKFKK